MGTVEEVLEPWVGLNGGEHGKLENIYLQDAIHQDDDLILIKVQGERYYERRDFGSGKGIREGITKGKTLADRTANEG